MLKKIGIAITALYFFSFWVGICSGEEKFKFYKCVEITKSPVIDGKLNDECWQKTEKATNFTLLGSKKGLAAEQTWVSIVYDKVNLYFGIECRENNIKEIVATTSIHDDTQIFADDCVEMFIDTNHDRLTYYHFGVNSLGTRVEEKEKDRGWDVPWEAKVSLGKSAWSLEIAIPFSSLGTEPKKGELWGLNLNRTRPYSCWSNTGGGFHAPDKFGHLVFDSYRICLEKELLPAYKIKRKEAEDLLKSHPKETKAFQDRFNQIDEEIKESTSGKESMDTQKFTKLYKILQGYDDFLYDLKMRVLLGE